MLFDASKNLYWRKSSSCILAHGLGNLISQETGDFLISYCRKICSSLALVATTNGALGHGNVLFNVLVLSRETVTQPQLKLEYKGVETKPLPESFLILRKTSHACKELPGDRRRPARRRWNPRPRNAAGQHRWCALGMWRREGGL